MEYFAQEWTEPTFEFTSFVFVLLLHIAAIAGIVAFLVTGGEWLPTAVAMAAAFVVLSLSASRLF